MIATADIVSRVRSEFDFSVERMPLMGPDNLSTPWYGLFRSDTGGTVGSGSVSENYTPHTTEHVVELVRASIKAFGEASDVDCYFKDGHYVSIAPTREYRKAVTSRDTVWPRLVIRAGLGGTTSFRVNVGYYRDLCKNLAMPQSVKSFHVNYRHTSGITSRLDQLTHDFQGLKEGWETLSSTIDMLNGRKVVIADIIKQVYGEIDPESSQRSRTVAENRVAAIVNRLLSERAGGNVSHVATAWEMYNAIQGYTLHDAQRKGKPTYWDRAISTASNQYVVRAEEILLAA